MGWLFRWRRGTNPPVVNLPNNGGYRRVVLKQTPVIWDLSREWPTEWSFIHEQLALGNAELVAQYRSDDINEVVFRFVLFNTEPLE